MTDSKQPEQANFIGEAIVPAKVTERLEVAVPSGAAATGAVVALAVATPTQMRRPWRSTVRTVFQALVGLASMWGLIVATLGLPDWAWVSASLAVAAGITRVMALPGVEVWLRRFFPWLAAAPDPSDRRKNQGGFMDVKFSLALIAICSVLITVIAVVDATRPGV